MGLKKLLTDLDYRTTISDTLLGSDIDFKTKSISHNDQFNNPPLIDRVSWDINNKNANPTFVLGKDHNKGGLDGGGLRGGIATNIDRRDLDHQRISAFLGDSISEESSAGEQFKWRQIGLQRMNPKINAPMEGLFGFSPANQRTYLPVSTKTAVRLAGVSQIKREGTTLGLFGNGYIDDKDFLENGNKNRLIYLYNKNLNLEPEDKKSGIADLIEISGDLYSNVMNFIGGKGEMLYDYNGGPNSVFGIGRTFIGRYTNTNPNNVTNPYGKGNPSYLETKKEKEEDPLPKNAASVREKTYGEIPYDENITKWEDKASGKHIYNYGLNSDKINSLKIFQSTDGSDFNTTINSDLDKDFIKFVFEVVDIDEPLKSNKMVFRAYLDSITDDYSATHNSVKYSGRAEKFYTYNEFDRKINLSFKIAAATRHEMKPIYQKLNYLVAQTAPNYKGTRMRTPYMKLTVGDWFNRVPGVLVSVNLSWSKDYPWEIKLDPGGQDQYMKQLPHILDVTVSFLPIHSFRPENSEKAPFISAIEDLSKDYDWNDEIAFSELISEEDPKKPDINNIYSENYSEGEDNEQNINPKKLDIKQTPKPTTTSDELQWTHKYDNFKEKLSNKGAIGTIKDAIKK